MRDPYTLTAIFTPNEVLGFREGTEALNKLVGFPAPDTGYDFMSKERDMQWYFKTAYEAQAAAERCRTLMSVKAEVGYPQ